ncbi:MAG: tetratricopeptide repeat protein [Sedimentisphaerales bacterium]|jgi:tetratricopeptide (TPR) repeat protein
MANNEIFVGRKDELNEFTKAIENPQGQAIIVVGNRGMGKTWLVNRMAKLASDHPTLKCGFVRYEVTPTDSPDSTMSLMIDSAFEAASTEPGSIDNVPERKRQWLALFKTFVPRGEQLIELMASLRRDPAKDTRQQFLERLELISKRMPENGRAIFIVDPEKYMAKDSDQTWAIVVKSLPEKIKFIFAQRTEDELVKGRAFKGLENVIWIPKAKLDVLAIEEVDDLVRLRAKEVGQEELALRGAVKRYRGHPYAIQAALGIIEKTKTIEGLPQDPTEEGVAEGQWEQVCDIGEDAMKLFEAYAVLEVAVPDDVVEYVSEVGTTTRKRLQGDKYLRGLLREEAGGKRIYHSILVDYALGQMSEEEKNKYHKRAMKIYRGKLKKAEKEQIKPDELAAVRLPEHILVAEGKGAFVDAFVNECFEPLRNLGLLDEAISFSERALGAAKKDSKEVAMVLGNLGLICQKRGELDKAEKMLKKAMEINEKLGWLEGMASQYGNLRMIYLTRGDLDKAVEMHKKSLEIEKKLGRIEGMANQYGNVVPIYRTMGGLGKAEEMYKKLLEIDKKLGRLEGMVSDYGNLGLIYQMRGESGKTVEMHKKAMEISEKIGRIEGMANQYGNLGLIYQTRGELDKAEEMYKKAMEIEKRLGLLEGMANQYDNLGLIYQMRGELDKAEEMHKKSLEISEKLGLREVMADQYGNLGGIYKQRGDLGRAREYWEKALDLYKKIGLPNEAKMVEGWIEKIKGK